MNFTDKHIIESYKNLLEGFENTKLELIENLSKSLKQKKSIKENAFYKSFGAFVSDKPAEIIIKEIKHSEKETKAFFYNFLLYA
jgi:hypothetical protein